MNQVIGKDDPKGKYTYDYPRPAMTADNVIFGFDGDALQVLLVERGIDPFKGSWALPGGFMRMNETVDECARRELMEETNVHDVYLEQFHVFSDPDRDPRGRVVTVAYIALVRPSDHDVIGGDDASRAMWFDVDMLPPLAFDHLEIIDMARARLKELLKIKPVAFRLLNEIFTVDELRRVYEVISGNSFDRRNFHRKLMQSNMISDIDEMPVCDARADEDLDCSCIASEPEPQMRISAPDPSCDFKEPRRNKSRKLRFFRFNKDHKDENNSSDEGSMKDLFNF